MNIANKFITSLSPKILQKSSLQAEMDHPMLLLPFISQKLSIRLKSLQNITSQHKQAQ